ncbi:unnamed protein product [Moneuplotes crassus]|uniref:Uncharacterized protein n=1 Tax=Euplotes crassus TaxID=5936 RepID=A0AAD1USN5_EUPCR|nr:unnamed protein product [Moneuplotes crassus]
MSDSKPEKSVMQGDKKLDMDEAQDLSQWCMCPSELIQGESYSTLLQRICKLRSSVTKGPEAVKLAVKAPHIASGLLRLICSKYPQKIIEILAKIKHFILNTFLIFEICRNHKI